MNTGKLFATSGLRDHRPRFETAMRHLSLALPLVLGQVPAAQAQVLVGIGLEMPGVNIGINLPTFPELQRVPGYPVYYAPQAPGNYFYYDALYWVFQADEWYASSWYNGPVATRDAYVCAGVCASRAGVLLPPAAALLQALACRCTAAVAAGPGVATGNTPGQGGTAGTAMPRHRQRRCPRTSAATRRAATRKTRLGNRRSAPRISDYRPHEPVSRQSYPSPDRLPHAQGRPVQHTEIRTAPAPTPRTLPPPQPRKGPPTQQSLPQQDRPVFAHRSPAPRQQAMPQDRDRPQERAEPSNPRQDKKGADQMSDRSPRYEQSQTDAGDRSAARIGAGTKCAAVFTVTSATE